MARYGEWSPECEYAGWLDGAAERPPRVGDRFTGHNRFAPDFVTSVTCVVTEVSRPDSFEWVVLDDSGQADRPGSIWHYRCGR